MIMIGVNFLKGPKYRQGFIMYYNMKFPSLTRRGWFWTSKINKKCCRTRWRRLSLLSSQWDVSRDQDRLFSIFVNNNRWLSLIRSIGHFSGVQERVHCCLHVRQRWQQIPWYWAKLPPQESLPTLPVYMIVKYV
jgi:hypothetical protein